MVNRISMPGLLQFHNVVSGAGVVPLTMLESIVDDYIMDASA